jgi:tetratricopeptide (TPR) repeat protein
MFERLSIIAATALLLNCGCVAKSSAGGKQEGGAPNRAGEMKSDAADISREKTMSDLQKLLGEAEALLYKDLEKAREQAHYPGGMPNTEQYEKAKELFLKALEIDPGSERAKEGVAACEEMIEPYIPIQHLAAPEIDVFADLSLQPASGAGASENPGAKEEPTPWEIRRQIRRSERKGMAWTSQVFTQDKKRYREESLRMIEEAKKAVQKGEKTAPQAFQETLARLQALQERIHQSWKGQGPEIYEEAALELSKQLGVPLPQ